MTSQPDDPDVLVTVGTDHHPFDRLIAWVDEWAGANPGVRVVAQHGTSLPLVAGANVALLRSDQLRSLLHHSRVVVTHGGPATIMECRQSGKIPIVVPRQPSLGEHVDDHQVRFTTRLARLGEVIVAADAGELHRILDEAMIHPDRIAHEVRGQVEATVVRFGEAVDAALARKPARRPRRPPRPRPATPSAPSRAAPDWRVLFLAGWGRSGSTLAARLLARSPGVVAVGEMREIFGHGLIEDRLCGCGEHFSACPMWTEVGRVAFGGWANLDAASFAALGRRFDRAWAVPRVVFPWHRLATAIDLNNYVGALHAIYSAIQHVSGAEVIVDTSKLASAALLARRCLPDRVGVVHLVRDSRGVAYSWGRTVTHCDRAGEPVRMERYGAFGAAVRYIGYNELVDRLGRRWLDPRRVSYEDLVADPVATTRSMLDHIDRSDLAVAELVDPSTGLVPVGTDHTIDGNPMRHGTGPVELRLDERWRTDMARPRRAMVTALTYPWLRRYGYRAGGKR